MDANIHTGGCKGLPEAGPTYLKDSYYGSHKDDTNTKTPYKGRINKLLAIAQVYLQIESI